SQADPAPMRGAGMVPVSSGGHCRAIPSFRELEADRLQPSAEQEAAEPRHLVASVERDRIVRGSAREIRKIFRRRVVAERPCIAEKVASVLPEIDMQCIRLARAE